MFWQTFGYIIFRISNIILKKEWTNMDLMIRLEHIVDVISINSTEKISPTVEMLLKNFNHVQPNNMT